jgi:pyruvyltransferase
MQKKINITYWKYNVGYGNFGDELSHVLVNTLLDKKQCKLLHNNRIHSTHNLVALGSYLHGSKNNDYIWGTGILDNFKHHIKNLHISSIRGRKTYQKLKKEHPQLYVPEKFGDPALIMPHLYQPKINPKYHNKIVIIPNHSKYKLYEERVKFAKQQDKTNEYILLDPVHNTIETVIDALYSSKFIISSSLHGLILGDAYGKDNIWFDDKLEYGDFKYLDYYSSIGIDEPLKINNILDWTTYDKTLMKKIMITPKQIYDTFPFEKHDFSSLNNCLSFKKDSNVPIFNFNKLFDNKSFDNNNFVIGLGEYCITAKTLDNLKIKKESFPFDWIFSNPEFVYESLNDDFTLLKNMIKQKQTDTGIIYENFPFNNIGIPHHDINKDSTKDYFEKRINNFYKALNSGKNVILLHINGSEKCETPYKQFEKISKILNEKFKSNIKIISITLKQKRVDKQYDLINTINNNGIELKVYHIYTLVSVSIDNWARHGSQYIKNCGKILMDNNVNFNVIHSNDL